MIIVKTYNPWCYHVINVEILGINWWLNNEVLDDQRNYDLDFIRKGQKVLSCLYNAFCHPHLLNYMSQVFFTPNSISDFQSLDQSINKIFFNCQRIFYPVVDMWGEREMSVQSHSEICDPRRDRLFLLFDLKGFRWSTSFIFLEREQDGVGILWIDVDPYFLECLEYGLAGLLCLLHDQFGLHAGSVHTYGVGIGSDLNSGEFYANNVRRVQDENQGSQPTSGVHHRWIFSLKIGFRPSYREYSDLKVSPLRFPLTAK